MSEELPIERRVMDASEVARVLGVSLGMVYKLLRQHRLAGYAVGRRKKIYADSIDAYREREAIRAVAPVEGPARSRRGATRPRKKLAATLPVIRHLH